MIFLPLFGKTIFLFPENMILYLTRKMKDDPSQKNTRKYDIFFKLSEKMVFPKKAAPADDLSCIIRKDDIFYPKTWYFFHVQKVRGGLSQEIHGNTAFYVYTYECYKIGATSLCQKKSKMVLSCKNTPKGDWRSRLASYKKLQQFSVLSWRPLQPFSCIALQRRKTGNLLYILRWIIFNTLLHSVHKGCVWRCAWVPIQEIICPLGDRL